MGGINAKVAAERSLLMVTEIWQFLPCKRQGVNYFIFDRRKSKAGAGSADKRKIKGFYVMSYKRVICNKREKLWQYHIYRGGILKGFVRYAGQRGYFCRNRVSNVNIFLKFRGLSAAVFDGGNFDDLVSGIAEAGCFNVEDNVRRRHRVFFSDSPISLLARCAACFHFKKTAGMYFDHGSCGVYNQYGSGFESLIVAGNFAGNGYCGIRSIVLKGWQTGFCRGY